MYNIENKSIQIKKKFLNDTEILNLSKRGYVGSTTEI